MASLQYTTASSLFAGVPDPYNSEAAKQQWLAENSAAAREQRLSSDGAIGATYQIAKTVINTVINIIAQVPIAQLIEWIGDMIGNAVTSMSSGGFDTLPALAKQRLALEMPGWGSKNPSKYKSQSFVGNVERFGVLKKPQIVTTTDAEFRRTLRNYLIAEAQAQEFARITKTADEPILPDVAIAALNQAGLYPPPIQPMRLTRKEWQGDYPQYDAWYSYNPPIFDGIAGVKPAINQGFVVSPSAQATLARDVSAQLQADYAADAALYSAQLVALQLALPAQLEQLVQRTQMAPRYGSAANPVMVSSTRRGRL